MSVEQRLSELQSKAQAVANECHRLGLLINQGVNTTDSPNFAGLSVGGNAVWHAGNDSVGRVGRPIVHWPYKASSGSSWWRVFSFTPTQGIKSASVVHISAFSSTSGLVDRAHWELVLSGVQGGDPTYSSAYLRHFGNITPDMFQLRYSTTTGEYTLFFYIPPYTYYGLYITFPKAPCPHALYDSAMEPTGSVNIPVKYEKAPVLLWSGSWAGGTINVPGIRNYTLIQVSSNDMGTPIIASRLLRSSEVFRGSGGRTIGASSYIETFHFDASLSGDSLTFVGFNSIQHISGGAHGTRADFTVHQIFGLS